jgi:hypothetical protein
MLGWPADSVRGALGSVQSALASPVYEAADCEMSLAFRTDPGWQHVAGSHQGWGDENFQVRPEPEEPALVDPLQETGACLKVPFTDANGTRTFIRFFGMTPDLYRETAASLGQPVLSDAERAAMLGDIRF